MINLKERKCTADDVIEGVLLLSERQKFPGDLSDFHSMFNEIRTKFPSLLEEFIFSINDVYPYSKLLERVLFRLFGSEIIEIESVLNPGQTKFLVSSLVTEEMKNNLRKEFKQKSILEEIEKAAKLFRSLCEKKEKEKSFVSV